MFYDADMIAMNYAVMDRQYEWAGVRLERGGDRVAVVRGNVIVPLSQKRRRSGAHNRDLNQLLLSSFHLSPQNLRCLLRGAARLLAGRHRRLSVVAVRAGPAAAEPR